MSNHYGIHMKLKMSTVIEIFFKKNFKRSTKLKYFKSSGFKIHSVLVCNRVTLRHAVKPGSLIF